MLISRHFISSFLALAVASTMPALLHAQEGENESLPAPIVAQSDSGAYHAINQLPESIRSSMPFAREFYEFARHAGNSGTVNNAAYRQAFEEAREDMLRSSERSMKLASPQNILSATWSNIGLTGSDAVPSGGINTVIAFDPQSPNIIYAGGSGGVWKSNDTGANWYSLTDNILPNLSVASIAVDPVSTNILYVGTGYCYSSVPMYDGTGLYQSVDGGASFNLLSVPDGAASFVKVVVDPAKHNIVLASSFDQHKVYRSTNSGLSWSSVFSQGVTWDMIATAGLSNTSILYLICGGDPSFGGTSGGGIYKSIDDGATWAKVTTASNFLGAASIGRAALASPVNAPNKIFALATNPSGAQVHLFLSTDAGANWDSLKAESQMADLFNPKVNAQGWYDLALAVTPNSVTNDTLYVDGVMGYLWHGTDAQLEAGTAEWDEFSDYDHSGGGGGYPHVDHHSLAINPVHSNIVYDGNDGGLWVNYAAGSNDVSNGGGWMLHSHNMVTNRFYHFSFVPRDTTSTWAGAQDQGLWKLSLGKDPVTFTGDHLGDAMQALVSAQNTNLVFAEGPEGQLVVESNGNWAAPQDTSYRTDSKGWDNPFRMSPVSKGSIPSSNILYLGEAHLWQTTSGGKQWTKFTPSFGAVLGGLSYCTAIGLPNWNASMIYAAGGGNSFQLSTDFGVSWHARTPPPSGFATSINTYWSDPKFVVVSMSSGTKKVMMSEDSGHTWTDASGTIAGEEIPGAGANSACNVMSLAIDSTNPFSTWYAATDFGLYVTQDAGQHWAFAGPGLFPCRDVQIAPNKITLRVTTYGRGIWENTLPLGVASVELTSLSATKGPNGSLLSWYVEGEPAGAKYIVERSVSGDAFQNIGTVPGLGASVGREDYSFADNTTAPGTYIYQIHEVDASGAERYTNHVELHYGTDGLYFSQPYPNPLVLNGEAAGAITLNFELPARDNALVRIYNTNGSLVRTLLDHPLDGGPHTLAWDARDAAGNLVAPGAYLCSIQTTQSGRVTNKIMVVRE